MIWVHHPKKHISYRTWIANWFARWPEAGWEHLWQGSHLGIFAANGRMGTVRVDENGGYPQLLASLRGPHQGLIMTRGFRGVFSRNPVFEPQFPRLVFPFCQRMSKDGTAWTDFAFEQKPISWETRMFRFSSNLVVLPRVFSLNLGYPNMFWRKMFSTMGISAILSQHCCWLAATCYIRSPRSRHVWSSDLIFMWQTAAMNASTMEFKPSKSDVWSHIKHHKTLNIATYLLYFFASGQALPWKPWRSTLRRYWTSSCFPTTNTSETCVIPSYPVGSYSWFWVL